MKQYSMETLSKENKELHDAVHEAFQTGLQTFAPEIEELLVKQTGFRILVHSMFVRIAQDDYSQFLFVQIQSAFALKDDGLLATILDATFYDTFEDYEKVRQDLIKQSAETFGFPEKRTMIHFKGISLN